MDRRELGRTGLHISAIGFGAFKIGRNVGIKYPHAYNLPTEAEATSIVHAMLDLGINYIDTAPAYGCSEERIGRALQSLSHEIIISTKVGETFEDGRSTYDFTGEGIRSSVHRSLRRLRRDVLDIVFIHSDGDELHILRTTDAVPSLQALKDEGLIRAIGLSGKTPAGANEAMSWADVLMIPFNANDREHEEVIASAGRAGAGIVVKKGIASGHLDADESIQFVLGNENVTSMVIGTLSASHMKDNIDSADACVRQ